MDNLHRHQAIEQIDSLIHAIEEYREKTGTSVSDLARLTNIEPDDLEAMLSYGGSPTLHDLTAIAAALDKRIVFTG